MDQFNFNEFKKIIGETEFFVYRTRGGDCYPILKERLCSIKSEETLKVIVPEDIIIDYSFADETVGQLFQEIWDSKIVNRYLIIQVSRVDQFENIEASINIRKLLALIINEKGQVIMVGRRGKDSKLVATLDETLNKLNDKQTLTASQLVQESGLELNAASMRLKRLYEAHLAKREPSKEDPRIFIYRSILK